MELHNFLRSRRSIRRFKPEPIEDTVIERILTTATYAPSAHNRQPWRFCVIKDPAAKSRLADAMAADFRRDLERDNLPPEELNARIAKSRDRINSTPLVIVLCMDMTEMDVYPDARRADAERMMAIQSTANAGLQLLLAAYAEGLGGVWTCGPLFAPEVVCSALKLPETWEPQAMIFLGHPSDTPRPKQLKPIEIVVRTF
jgi:coenzyme F420-0:L-glutamate ligase / coenzyme F420-1:gamma-L-glutamate ligase